MGNGIGQGMVVREPYGVAALITAFNFPFLLNLAKLGPALAAGCTAVLKSSPYTPLEALVLGEIAEAAGLPPGVLNIVTGDIPAGERLTRHPGVDLVSFTGSDAVGRKVYAQGAESIKKVVLELGGKSANIILDDADLDNVLRKRSGRLHHARRAGLRAADQDPGAPVAARRSGGPHHRCARIHLGRRPGRPGHHGGPADPRGAARSGWSR